MPETPNPVNKLRAHRHTPHARLFDIDWRAPDPSRVRGTTRTCSYCGSIHPADLAKWLRDEPGVTVELADMKYGWPHKLYIHNGPGGAWAKFYTEHLQDAEPEDRDRIERAYGLRFTFEDGGAVRWNGLERGDAS